MWTGCAYFFWRNMVIHMVEDILQQHLPTNRWTDWKWKRQSSQFPSVSSRVPSGQCKNRCLCRAGGAHWQAGNVSCSRTKETWKSEQWHEFAFLIICVVIRYLYAIYIYIYINIYQYIFTTCYCVIFLISLLVLLTTTIRILYLFIIQRGLRLKPPHSPPSHAERRWWKNILSGPRVQVILVAIHSHPIIQLFKINYTQFWPVFFRQNHHEVSAETLGIE